MIDLVQEIESVRDDVKLVNEMIDEALDDPGGNNVFLRACVAVLQHRLTHLAELEQLAP